MIKASLRVALCVAARASPLVTVRRLRLERAKFGQSPPPPSQAKATCSMGASWAKNFAKIAIHSRDSIESSSGRTFVARGARRREICEPIGWAFMLQLARSRPTCRSAGFARPARPTNRPSSLETRSYADHVANRKLLKVAKSVAGATGACRPSLRPLFRALAMQAADTNRRGQRTAGQPTGWLAGRWAARRPLARVLIAVAPRKAQKCANKANCGPQKCTLSGLQDTVVNIGPACGRLLSGRQSRL